MVDSRFNEKVENTPLGYNMSAFIKIKNNELCIEYHDTKNKLLSENWVVDDDGNISGSITIPESCPIKPVPGKSWEDAVN